LHEKRSGKMTLDRERISRLVSLYVDGTATAEETAELETAIEEDSSAAEIFYDLSLQHVLLQRLARLEPSAQDPVEQQGRRVLPFPTPSWRNRLREAPRIRWMAMAASILLCLSLAAIWSRFHTPSDKPKMATLLPSGPDITLVRAGAVVVLGERTPLVSGDQIIVSPHSRGKICWQDKCHLFLDGYAHVTFQEKGEDASKSSRVFLSHGTIHADHSDDASQVDVETPQMYPSHIYASKLTVVVEGGETYVKVHKGQLLAVRKNDRGEHRLSSGDELIITGRERMAGLAAPPSASGSPVIAPASARIRTATLTLCGALKRLDGLLQQFILNPSLRSFGKDSMARGLVFLRQIYSSNRVLWTKQRTRK
jgi:hypothetical protein